MPDFTSLEHGKFFTEFCKLEKELKGPDPQLETTYQMCLIDGTSLFEMIWRAGVLVGVWNVPTAEAIWKEWPWEKVMRLGPNLEPWLTENWAGIFTRRERRCVRTPAKMAKYLVDYSRWVPKVLDLEPDYEVFWNSVQEDVKFMGRYVTLKLLEFIGRYCGIPISCPDIRAAGGWSPVRTLTMLYPDLSGVLDLYEHQKQKIEVVEIYAAATLKKLQETIPSMNFFELQVMLCEYRTGYEHAHQYPGRSLDEELEYAAKIGSYWDSFRINSQFWQARLETFPTLALGEQYGWLAIRKELGTCLRDHGYLWSDIHLDYVLTDNLNYPVARFIDA